MPISAPLSPFAKPTLARSEAGILFGRNWCSYFPVKDNGNVARAAAAATQEHESKSLPALPSVLSTPNQHQLQPTECIQPEEVPVFFIN